MNKISIYDHSELEKYEYCLPHYEYLRDHRVTLNNSQVNLLLTLQIMSDFVYFLPYSFRKARNSVRVNAHGKPPLYQEESDNWSLSFTLL